MRTTRVTKVARTTLEDVVARRPEWVRGPRLGAAATSLLYADRFWFGPDAGDLRSRILTSGNPDAVMALLDAGRGRGHSDLVAEAGRLLARRSPGHAGLALAAAGALREAGRADDAAGLLRQVSSRPVPAGDVPVLIRELTATHDTVLVRECLERLAAGQPADGLPQEVVDLRRALDAVAATATVPEALRTEAPSAGFDSAIASIALDPKVSTSQVRDTVDLLDARGAWHPDVAYPLIRNLYDRGDLTVAGRAAQHLVDAGSKDKNVALIARNGSRNAALIPTGWQPPVRAERQFQPRPGSVFYLLHNSLPHVSGGYATRTHGLLTGLQRRGWEMHGVTRPAFPYDVQNLSADVPLADEVDGVAYHRLLEGRQKFPFWPLEAMVENYTRLLRPLLTEQRPGIIHGASNFRNGLAATAAARQAGLPSIYEVRGLWELTRQVRDKEYIDTDQYELATRLEADACRAADRVFVITKGLREVMVERGVAEEKIVLLPNGVDTDRFAPQERDEALAAELGVTGKTVIGYVGTTVDYEGLGLLVEAAATLKQERQDFAVLVVGDGPALEGWRRQAHAAGLRDVITFTGRVPHEDVERYYSVIDVAPLPRLPELVCEVVSPLKPFELMAVGKTIVASDVAALGEIVDDGVTGLLFEKGSAASLTAVLRTALDQRELRARLSEQAREWVVRERDWSALAGRADAVYRDLWSEYHPDVPAPTA